MSGERTPRSLSRRRFVAVVAAGSAALLARPAAAATAAAKAVRPVRARTAAAPAMTVVQRKEYERQRTGMLDMLRTIRAHALPAGSEPASVFRARRAAKKAR